MSGEQPFRPEVTDSPEEEFKKTKEKLDKLWESSQRHQQKQAQASSVARSPETRLPKTEQERGRERAVKLVLEKAGVRVHTSISRELSPRGNDGFQDLNADLKRTSSYTSVENALLTSADVMARVSPEDIMRDHSIHEFISIHQEITAEYNDVTTPGKNGILGIGRTPARVDRVKTGRELPVQHADIVMNGNTELAVNISYYIPQSNWRDYSGRRGQMMRAEMVLPQSAAQEVEDIIDRDPAAIRSIISEVMKQKLLIDPKAWESPQGQGDALRPPYEEWDNESGGHIYVQKDGIAPGFHPEAVRKVT